MSRKIKLIAESIVLLVLVCALGFLLSSIFPKDSAKSVVASSQYKQIDKFSDKIMDEYGLDIVIFEEEVKINEKDEIIFENVYLMGEENFKFNLYYDEKTEIIKTNYFNKYICDYLLDLWSFNFDEKLANSVYIEKASFDIKIESQNDYLNALSSDSELNYMKALDIISEEVPTITFMLDAKFQDDFIVEDNYYDLVNELRNLLEDIEKMRLNYYKGIKPEALSQQKIGENPIKIKTSINHKNHKKTVEFDFISDKEQLAKIIRNRMPFS